MDCNFNGSPDTCDLVDETSIDCQSNGIPDECETGFAGRASSGELSPIDRSHPQNHLFIRPPMAESDVAVTLRANADLRSNFRWITVEINGELIGDFFRSGLA